MTPTEAIQGKGLRKDRNPYVGPRSIGGREHPDEKIYGRERVISRLMNLLIADRIVLVYSPSGAGKTSLLQAGLAPLMKAQGFQISPMLRVNSAPPPEVNFDPANGNRYVLSTLLSMEEGKKEGRRPATELARLTLADYFDANPTGELLIFDQFEEILTVEPLDVGEKKEFFGELGDILRNRGRWAIFAMREDYIAGLDAYTNLVPTRFANTFRLGLLDTEDALKSVCGPAAAEGVEFDEEAARSLVRNLSRVKVQREEERPGTSAVPEREEDDAGAPGLFVEPVQLQVVCRRIWNAQAAGIQRIGLDAVGGVSTVDQALAEYYGEAVRDAAKKSGVTERAIRTWFGRSLITRQKTRSQVSLGDDATKPVRAAIEPLRDSYVIRADRRLGTWWYELAHDRLIGPVLKNNAENTPELQRRAEMWEGRGRPDVLLLRGRDYGALKDLVATDLEREFVDKSRHRRVVKRNLIGLAIGVALGVIVVSVLMAKDYKRLREMRLTQEELDKAKVALAVAQADFAQEAERTGVANRSAAAARDQAVLAGEGQKAATSRQISARLVRIAAARRNARADLAALLAVEAWKQEPSTQAKFTMFDVLQANPRVRRMLHHPSQVNAVAFGPKDRVATGCADGSVWFWSIELNSSRKLSEGSAAVLSLAFDRNGLLAAGSADGTLRVWESASRRLIAQFPAHKGRLSALTFDPGGTVLVSGGQDGIIRFWKVAGGSVQPGAQVKAGPEVKSVAIRMDQRELVAALAGGNAVRWPLSPDGVAGRDAMVNHENSELVGVSAAGQAFLVKGNGSVKIFGKGLTPESQVGNFRKDGWLWAAALSPDGKLAAVGGDSRIARIYDVGNANPWLELNGPETRITALSFSADAKMLATLSEHDRSVWVWNVPRTPAPLTSVVADARLVQGEPLQNFVMGPQGKWFATTLSLNGTTVARFLAENTLLGWSSPLTAPAGGKLSDQWREDGRVLLAASPDPGPPFLVTGEAASVAIRNHQTLQTMKTFKPSTDRPAGMALNFDGTLLAISGWRRDPNLRIYSLANPADPAPPPLLSTTPGPAVPLEAMAFHPTRNILAAGGNTMMGDKIDPQNSEVRLWDLANPKAPRLYAILPNAGAHRAIFSPDGKTLVTAGHTTSLWDVPEGPPSDKPVSLLPRAVLAGTTGWSRHLAFSPRGDLLVTAESNEDSSTVGNRIHFWDPAWGIRLAEPVVFPWPVDVAGFERDGRSLLLWSTQGIVRLWLDPDAWAHQLCGRANRNLSQSEWDTYIGATQYRPTCRGPNGEGVK